MAKIDPVYIEQLLSRINIVDLIQGRLTLKKAGKDYQACCPFHQEKTPSFTVSEEKQFFHCFGCGEHGSAISFLMKYDGLSFPEAIETLSQKTGLPLPESTRYQKPKLSTDPYELLDQCCQLFSKQLTSSEVANSYVSERQLDATTIQKFRIGYATDSWDQLLKHFANEQTKIEVLSKLDMLVNKQADNGSSKVYDRFRNRLTFPIIDRRGRVVAFGARVLNPEDQPKYLNNSETPIFQKRREIYGLYQCLQAQRTPPYLIVTEGYMDVISLHQAGIPNAVASMGTALTIEQISTLFRHTKCLIFSFDGDNAGQKATERGLKTILPHIKEEWILEFLLLPEGVDPDSYVKQHGKENFLTIVEKSLGIIEFIKHSLQQHGEIDNPEHKPRLAREAKQWINSTANNAWRHALIESLSEYLKIDSQYLIADQKTQISQETHFDQMPLKNSRYAPSLNLESRFLIYSLSHPSIIQRFEEAEISILSAISPLSNQLIQVICSADLSKIPVGILVEQWNGTADYETLKKYLVWDNPLDEEATTQELKKIITKIKQKDNQEQWQKLQHKMKMYGEDGLTDDEKQDYLGLLSQRVKLSK